MFTVEERDRVAEYLVEKAREDPRIVAGAAVDRRINRHAKGVGAGWGEL